jgi:AcrR family transcriptional regulator
MVARWWEKKPVDKNERSYYFIHMITKGQETRAAILDKAAAISSRLGLEALSIGGLAGEVGMSKSGLFGHFHSKEQLQLDVLQFTVDRFVARVIAPSFSEPRGIPRIRALFANWISWERSAGLPGGCLFITASTEFDDRPGRLRDKLVAYQQDWVDVLATAARIAVEEGHFRPDLDREQFAYDFYSCMLAYHHFSRLMHDPEALPRAERSFERLIESSKA